MATSCYEQDGWASYNDVSRADQDFGEIRDVPGLVMGVNYTDWHIHDRLEAILEN
jgi:hypothetical protein